MPDATLRQEARRPRSVFESEVRALAARLRAGTLSRERVELAAFCGHTPAGLITGVRTGPRDLERFCEGLTRFGQGPCVRAARLVAGEVPTSAFVTTDQMTHAVTCLRAVERWLDDPSAETRRAAVDMVERSIEADEDRPEDESAWWEQPGRLLLLRDPKDVERRPGERAGETWGLFLRIALHQLAMFAFGFAGPDDVLDADDVDAAELVAVDLVRDRLIAWALDGGA